MRAVSAVFRREIAGLFGQPPAYVALAVWVLLVSLFSLWLDDVLAAGVCAMDRPLFWMAVGLVVLVPAIAMRLFADERRTGTFELLATLPARPIELVVGKWLAATAFVGVALAVTAPWPVALRWHGPLDPGPVIGGYLGLWLLGAAFAAIGTLCSAIADHPTVAFLTALFACLAPWLLGFALPIVPGAAAPIVEYLSFQHHVDSLARGVIDTRSVLFLGSIAALGVYGAALALEARRLQ